MWVLTPSFGSKKFKRFYQVLKNISLLGLNYRGTDISSDGELFFMNAVKDHYKSRSGSVVLFDVGANVGNYSKALDKVFAGINREIYAFEPFSKAYEALCSNSSSINNLKAHRLGLSDKKETVSFLSSTEYSEVGGLYEKDFSQFNFSLDIKEEVEFDTIENFCERNNIAEINFLKVDVEGHDFFAIKGAGDMLAKNKIEFIQFEYGAANYLSKTYLYDFFQLLAPHYNIYRLLNNGFDEIATYNTDIEIHVLSNYIAISKKSTFKVK